MNESNVFKKSLYLHNTIRTIKHNHTIKTIDKYLLISIVIISILSRPFNSLNQTHHFRFDEFIGLTCCMTC